MYQMISGTYQLDGKTYTSYGIQCGATRVADITTNRPALAALLALCNRCGLEECHLADVIDDFLAKPEPIVHYAVPSGEGWSKAI